MESLSAKDESDDEIEKRQLKRAHRSNSDPTISNQNLNIRKKVNLGGSENQQTSSSNVVFQQWLQADFTNIFPMPGILDGSFLSGSFLDSLPDLMGDLAHKVEPVQKHIPDFEPMPDLDEVTTLLETRSPRADVGDLEFQMRNSLMDDCGWSSGDIDKDLLSKVNDPLFWQQRLKESSGMSTPNSLKSSQIHIDPSDINLQEFTFNSMGSMGSSTNDDDQFENINRKEALDIVSAANSTNSVAVLQEYISTTLDPNSVNLSEVFTSFPDSVVSLPIDKDHVPGPDQQHFSNFPPRELPREDSFLPSVPVPLSSRASFTAGRQNAQRWNDTPVQPMSPQPLQPPQPPTSIQSVINMQPQPAVANSPNAYNYTYPAPPFGNNSPFCQPVTPTYQDAISPAPDALFTRVSSTDQITLTEDQKKKQATAAANSKEKVSNRGNYRCGRCGQPKVNHNCKVTDAVGATVAIQTTTPIIDIQTLQPFAGERFLTIRTTKRYEQESEVANSPNSSSLTQIVYGAQPITHYNANVDIPNSSSYATMDLQQPPNPYFNYYHSNAI